MKIIRIFMTLCCLIGLYGCGDINVVEHCFEPVQFKAGELFSSDSIRVTPVWGNNSEEAYLKDHDVVGYLSPSGLYEPIKPSSILTFTGSVYKVVPSVAERYLGGSAEHRMFEAVLEDAKYIVFDFPPQNTKLPYPTGACTF